MSFTTFNKAFSRTQYPAGERHVVARDLDALRSIDAIEATVCNFAELCEVVVADRILRRNDIQVEWFVPYLPFARDDRRNTEADGLEVELALELVKEIDIVIADPHSEVTAVLAHFPQEATVEIMRSKGAMIPMGQTHECLAEGLTAEPIILIPDAGAAKKVGEWADGADTVQALKTRDPQTGKLSGFEVIAEDLGGRPCVIVDDICDGGGTFLGLAKELGKHNAGPLTLIITHGLFTKGLDELTQAFDRIYTFGPTDEVPLATTTGRLTRLPFRVLYEKGIRR